ncbi:type III PLP-dependent enzyme [Brevibacillus sp. SYSU BS000544]|uniref:type III PLP-dependent enzyme n=1 Tax=Brevibacillus sp. SYSU BS000544 TaxID=3416443 RepID=UPI003CE47C1A
MNKLIQIIEEKKNTQDNPICAYIYDLDALQQHVEEVARSLPPSCRLFYAMKANSEAQIVKTISKHVYGLEVASLGEVKKARAVDASIPVIFGGPGKTDEEIRGAIEHQVKLIHVESINELQRINLIASSLNCTVSILLRVNLAGPFPQATLAMAGKPTQFGIDESEIGEAIQLALSCEHVSLEGFHLHSISNQLDDQSHLSLIEYYFDKVDDWSNTYGITVTYINVGGGIGINYAELDKQFAWSHFVNGLSALIQRRNKERTTIIFECGRFLTAACGYYATEVIDIKRNHGKNFVIVRGGTQHFRLPVSWQHNHPFLVLAQETWKYPFQRKKLWESEVTIVGQLCTPKDVFAKDAQVKQIRVGDVILFLYAGAYGWAISHHDFLSHPHPEHIYLTNIPVMK